MIVASPKPASCIDVDPSAPLRTSLAEKRPSARTFSRLLVQSGVRGGTQNEAVTDRALFIDRNPKLRIFGRLVGGRLKILLSQTSLAD